MFYCHLSAFSRQTVYNEIIISWQYTLIIQLTIAIVHSIVSRIMLLFQFDYLIKSPLVSMLCSCHAFGMLVPRLWHDCDKPLAQLCQALCTTVSEVWHNHFRRWHNRSDSLSQTVCILERETTKGEVLVTVWNEGSSRTQKRRFFLLTVVWMT